MKNKDVKNSGTKTKNTDTPLDDGNVKKRYCVHCGEVRNGVRGAKCPECGGYLGDQVS